MSALAEHVYLDSYLAPLAPLLARPDVTDIWINRPGETWVETLGGAIERADIPGLTRPILTRLARQIAAHGAQGVSREHPLLAAALPDGSRVQVVLPPATRGEIAIAIRKHTIGRMRLTDYDRQGAFDETRRAVSAPTPTKPAHADSVEQDKLSEVLARAVAERRNILVSGGTSTGKTTFLNALLAEVPEHERLILIEDTPELQAPHANQVGLIAARGHTGEADVTAEDLLIASLRMRPDRIILGEVRGREATTFLRAINTGHPGSLSSIHADSPERAIDQLAMLVVQGGLKMDWGDVVKYVLRSIDLIVQLGRSEGQRKITSIFSAYLRTS